MSNLSVKNEFLGTVFETGYKVLKNRGLAIIWMSVGNPHFNKENIKELIKFCSKNFNDIKVLIPFGPSRHTFEAIGYNSTKALSKGRLHSNRLKNHTKKVLNELEMNQSRIQIIDWENEIYSNVTFAKILNEIENLYLDDKSFHVDCNVTTKQVLEGKLKTNKNIDDAIKIGVKYLHEELAFVLASPVIFDVKYTVYIYHNRWHIYENLVNGKYKKKGNYDVGFLLVN